MRGRLGICLLLLAPLPTSSQTHAQCNPEYPLGTLRTWNSPSDPRAVLPGDFDDDGLLDVVVVASSVNQAATDSGSVRVWRGDGSGQFTPLASVVAGHKPFDGAAADLNGDGRLDVVTADFSSGTITTLLGTGSGTFVRHGSWPAGVGPFAVALADCDGDVDLDAVVSLNGAGQAIVLRGNGDGTFGAPLATLATGTHPAGLCAADFDADGDTDVAAVGYDANALLVFTGNGDGTFQPPVTHPVPGSPWAVIPIDQDLDGRIDLVVSSTWQLGVYLFQGTATGFVPRGFSPTGFTTAGLATGDFDQDGRPDVVAGLSALKRIMVLRNAGPGANPPFAATGASMGAFAIGVGAGDFDGDGRPDVVAADYALHRLAFTPGVCVPLAQAPTPLLTLWQAEGRPISAGVGVQSSPVACTDDVGGAYVAWLDNRGGGVDLYATHVDSDGQTVPGWTPGGDPVFADPSVPEPPQIVPNGLGGAVVGWSDARTGLLQVYATRLLPAGLDPAWPPGGVQVSSDVASAKRLSAVASDRAGGAYFAWTDGTIGQGYAGRLDANGAAPPGWNPAGFALGPAIRQGYYQRPTLSATPDGGVFVTYGVEDTYCPYYPCYPYDAWVVGRFLQDGSYTEMASMVNEDPYIWAFPGDQGDVLARYGFSGESLAHVTASGIDWTRTIRFPGTPGVSSAIPDGSSGFLVGFQLSDWDDRNIYLLRLTSSGLDSADWPFNGQAICTAPGWQGGAGLISDGSGGAVMVWSDGRDETGQLYGQHVRPGGALPPGTRDGVRLCTAPGARQNLSMFPSVGSSALLVWLDTRSDAGDIYAQRITWDAVVPVAYSVVVAEAEPGRAFVRWYAAADAGAVVVETRIPAGKWHEAARVSPDGDGMIAFEDRNVMPGSRHGYRLVPATGGPVGEVWVDVPAARLDLLGAVPNPGRSPLRISLSLANGHDARLELFDLAGRRIDGRRVGSLGPGRHQVELGGSGLAAGVYLLRLQQDRRVMVRRALVLE